MPPNEPNQEEKPEQEFEETRVDDTHPSTDAGLQQEELYDTGLNVVEPNAGNAVEAYDPAKDQRLGNRRSAANL